MRDINADNPFKAFKAAIDFALGCGGSGRPVFKERGIDSITMCNDISDYKFEFGDLNYNYVNELVMSDSSVFTAEDYGKYFYEYGRTLLGNLMICLCKADWNSVSTDSNGEAQYVANYYNQLLKLSGEKLHDVINHFKKDAISQEDYLPYELKYGNAAFKILEYKEVAAAYRDSKDMKNTDIFYCAYVGLMYSLYGLFILLSSVSGDYDVLSFFKTPKSKSVFTVYDKILKEIQLGNNEKKHMISLVYCFYIMTKFYQKTSGLKKMDPVVGTLFDVCETFVDKIKNSDSEAAVNLRSLVDPDITESYTSAPCLKSFTSSVDQLTESQYFRSCCVLDRDNTNIFEFGLEYLKAYNPKNTVDEDQPKLYNSGEILPAIKVYLEEGLKSSYSEEDIERGFGSVTNLLNGIEDANLFSNVDPGFILQLILTASTFRVLDKKSTRYSDKSRKMINGAIDILDILILRLYQIWFKSNKYFIQPKRPKYLEDQNINTTLTELKNETFGIIANYLEFVKFGTQDIPNSEEKLYYDYLEKYLNEFTIKPEWINENFPYNDDGTFIICCAGKKGRSIVQFAMLEEDKSVSRQTFAKLIKKFENSNIPKEAIKSLSKEPNRYTGINHIDRVIDYSYSIRDAVYDDPQVYAVAVYGIYWFTIDMLLRKFNTGNYFDFGIAEDNMGSYGIEATIKKLIAVPLKKVTDFDAL